MNGALAHPRPHPVGTQDRTPATHPFNLPLPCRSHTKYRQRVFEELLRNMPPRDVADLLQAKQFLAQFACPPS